MKYFLNGLFVVFILIEGFLITEFVKEERRNPTKITIAQCDPSKFQVICQGESIRGAQ